MEYSVNFYCNLLQEPENFYPAELPEFVDLLNDQGFKHVFGRDANKDILIALLNKSSRTGLLLTSDISAMSRYRQTRKQKGAYLTSTAKRKMEAG